MTFFGAISNSAFAQGVIYKCIDSNGNVAYLTESTGKNCTQTNLAKIDQTATLNKVFVNLTPSQGSSSDNNNNNTIFNSNTNPEQIVRDQKRILILKGELEQEKNQLSVVQTMFQKIEKSNDKNQIEQLSKMIDSHKRNIAALEKEIGIKNNITMTKTEPTQNQVAIPNPTKLPFSLPNGVENVEIVTPPPLIIQGNNQAQSIPQKPQPQLSVTDRLNLMIQLQQAQQTKPIQPKEEIKQPEIIRRSEHPPMITNKSLKKKSDFD